MKDMVKFVVVSAIILVAVVLVATTPMPERTFVKVQDPVFGEVLVETTHSFELNQLLKNRILPLYMRVLETAGVQISKDEILSVAYDQCYVNIAGKTVCGSAPNMLMTAVELPGHRLAPMLITLCAFDVFDMLSDEQILGVLCHEVSHWTKGHIERLVAAERAGAPLNIQERHAMEFEADAEGAKLMRELGVDVNAYVLGIATMTEYVMATIHPAILEKMPEDHPSVIDRALALGVVF